MRDPVKETFASEQSMRDRAAALEAEGRTIVELEDQERGMLGILAYTPPPDGAGPDWEIKDAVLLEWPRYGRPLEKIETIVENAITIQGAYNEHVGHRGFSPFVDPITKSAGLVCHCLADVGKSIVFTVPLRTLKMLPAELLKAMFPT